MRRTLKNNAEVCHVFVSQSQPEGKCGNIFFVNNRIYSYGSHYLMGMIHKRGTQSLLLVNNIKYSSSTAKHLSELRSAASGAISYLEVVMPSDPKASLERLHADIGEEYLEFFSRRTIRYDWDDEFIADFIKRFDDKISGFNKACDFFRCKALKINITQDHKRLWIEKIESLRETYKNSKTPEALAKKDADRLKRAAYKEAQAKVTLAKAIADFRAGGLRAPELRDLRPMLLRVNNNQVETSSGAYVSIEDALNLLKLIESGDAKKGERVGPYSFTQRNGDILQIGCHTFDINEARSVLLNSKAKLALIQGGVK